MTGLSPRLQVATQIAAALVSAPSSNGFPAGMSREPARIATQAVELADALLACVGEEWDDVRNAGDETAIDNARHQ